VSPDELIDHERRIAALERQVAELYGRIGQGEPASDSGFDSGFEPAASVGAAADPRLQELVAGGDHIGAVKLYRELTGAGLAEAKDAVDRLAAGG
jgi:ribosomal protein L7/L12